MTNTQGSTFDGALIVIPCLNEARHLPGLLTVLGQEAPTALIVVADGGSTDGSPDIVRDFAARGAQVRLMENPRRIQSAGVNLAARRFGAEREWMIRVDAHCGYGPGFLTGLLAAADRTGATSVVVPMATEGETCFQKACAAAQNSVLGTGGSAHRRLGEGQFVDHGHHALFRLEAFLAAGGYDETFSHNEDAELDARLVEAGARIWLEPAAAIVYYPRRTPAALFRQYIKYGEGRARTIQRHRPKLKVRQMLPLVVAPAVLVALAGFAWWPLALPALMWAALCLGFGVLLGVRQRSACAALAGVAAMIMHFAWSAGFLHQMLLGRRPGARPIALSTEPAG